MLPANRTKLLETVSPDDRVLDIGGWADPFERADWVVDMFPYETRGLYERRGWIEPRADRARERFSKDTWVERDVCDREPFPFDDDQFDLVICSHTLEDIRDPVWVCSEMARIGKAGYIEVPSRLEEQSWGVVGPFVGWTHHHWLIDVFDDGIEFVFKPHVIHSVRDYQFPRSFWEQLTDEERVESLWWEGSFTAKERVIFELESDDISYLREYVDREMAARGFERPREGRLQSRFRARAGRFAARLRSRGGAPAG